MKIGLITPVGRSDKYGYQYHDIIKLILRTNLDFADKIVIVSTSKYADSNVFLIDPKIEFISNEKTWFQSKNGIEEFSLEQINRNLNYGIKKLIEEQYDIAMMIAINTYIPKNSINNIKKKMDYIIKRRKPFGFVYKRYMCNNLFFQADVAVPDIINLKIENPWIKGTDSVINPITGETISFKSGNFKKYNNSAVIDLPWELTINDAKEKFEFVIKEYQIERNDFDPNNTENLKFNQEKWFNYYQYKINLKALSKDKLDDIGREILSLRQKEFVSSTLEKNYRFIFKKNIFLKAEDWIKNILSIKSHL